MISRVKGFSLIELAVVAVVLSTLMAVFLERLTFYQGAAERAEFEATLSVYKTALQIRLAELMVERRENEAQTLEVENPTRWLSEKPTNYAGDYPSQPQPGWWYFDQTARELVYVANSGRELTVETGGVLKQLRFRVQIVYQTVEVAGAQVRGIGGIALRPTVVYRWF